MATILPAIAGGNWSANGSWIGSVPPTAADDVDYSGLTGTLTIDGTSGTPNLCRSFTATACTGTLVQGSGGQLNVGDGTTGAFKIVSGLTYAPNALSLLKFISTSGGVCQITFGGKTFGSVTFDGIGGSWQYQDAALFAATAQTTLTNGTLDTNGKTVTNALFSSSNSNTRALTLGATTWTTGNSTPVWDIGTSTGMTLSAASSTISITATNTNTTFNGGGLTYGTVTQSALTATTTINQNNTFGTLTLSNGTNSAANYQFGGNQTVTGTLTGAGNSLVNRLLYRSTVRGTQRTLTTATVTMSQIDLQDMKGAGAGNWNLSAITGNSGDCGGNDVSITFTTPANQYWVPSGGTSTGSESAVTRWANASGGTAGTGRSPLPQDMAIFDASSIDAGSRTVTQDKSRSGAHNFTGVTNTPAWAVQATSCFGNITLVSGMTMSGATIATMEKRGALNLTSAGLTWTAPIVVDSVNGVGSLVLADNLASSSSLTTTSGTFDTLTNSKTASFTTNVLNGGTVNLGANETLSGAFTINGATINLSTFNISGGTTMTFQNGTITGTGTISGTTITFSGAAAVLSANTPTISGTTITLNGSGATWDVGTVTGTGGITATTGTLNMHGTLTANTNAHLVPIGSGGMIQSRVFSGY